jgi:hypothetical protein
MSWFHNLSTLARLLGAFAGVRLVLAGAVDGGPTAIVKVIGALIAAVRFRLTTHGTPSVASQRQPSARSAAPLRRAA